MHDQSAHGRAALAQRMYARGITDTRVLRAIGDVPRECFVPADVADDAYEDEPLPIGSGQTISAPFIVALMTQALRLRPQARALEVGTGSGYAAAVLSRCCEHVVTIERHAELAERAGRTLRDLGYRNVEVLVGDGSLGAPDHAPFDAITVTAMADGRPPPSLMSQLAPGATIVCPVGKDTGGDLLRIQDGERDVLSQVVFVPLVTDSGC